MFPHQYWKCTLLTHSLVHGSGLDLGPVWADPLRMKNVAGLLLLFFCLILTHLVASFKMAGLFKTHLSLGNWDDSLAGLGFLITKHQRNNFLKVKQCSQWEKDVWVLLLCSVGLTQLNLISILPTVVLILCNLYIVMYMVCLWNMFPQIQYSYRTWSYY